MTSLGPPSLTLARDLPQLSYVHETLFPYALDNLRSFFKASAAYLETGLLSDEEAFKVALEAARALEVQAKEDKGSSPEVWSDLYKDRGNFDKFVDQAYAAVSHHTRLNRKISALKDLQSLIWEVRRAEKSCLRGIDL